MIKFLVLIGFSIFSPEVKEDSIGVEIINGKTFVVHKVEAGETLYAISKRYGVTVPQILEFNPTADGGLEVDLILKVPYVPRPKLKPAEGSTHTVAEKETLYSISKLYGVSMEEIKQWNNLADNTLAIGQELSIRKKNNNTVAAIPVEVKSGRGVHVVAAKETIFSISRQYGITVAQLREWNGLQTDELRIGQSLMVIQPAFSQNQVAQTKADTSVKTVVQKVEKPEVLIPAVEKGPDIRISEHVRDRDEIIESGLAELIDGTASNRKYLALHRTAPIGTILKVKNTMNNREVFVRVMGKLQDTGLTDKLVIRISKSAYDRLGAIDPRFMVEVTYYK